MAFAYTVTGTGVLGNKRIKYGTYTNGVGDVGGLIATGLRVVHTASLSPNTAAPSATRYVISGGNITVTTSGDEDGLWSAIGV
jgi:hypothetical protein